MEILNLSKFYSVMSQSLDFCLINSAYSSSLASDDFVTSLVTDGEIHPQRIYDSSHFFFCISFFIGICPSGITR